MQVCKIPPRGFAANCYLCTENGRDAIAVDPAQPGALGEAARRGLSVRFVLLTHGHFDHIGGCAAMQRAGAKIGCLEGEEELALRHNLGMELGGTEVARFSVDFTFRDGEILGLCGLNVEVIATPGHTSGSACFLIRNGGRPALFTGDTLFAGDCGRTDLPTGSPTALDRSLKRLFALPTDCTVYPGHGENTELFAERRFYGGER